MALPTIPERLNLCVEFLDRNVREGRGDRVALLYGEERYTYAEVLERVCEAANLLGELGLEPEQRVLLMLSDHPEFVFFWFAAVRMGAVVSAVNPEAKPEELAYYLEYTRSRVLVAEERLVTTGAVEVGKARWLKGTVVCRGDGSRPGLPPRVQRWEDRPRTASAWNEPADTLADDVCVMLYTSGSTGFPKAVVHRHVDFVFNLHAYGLPVLRYTPDDVTVGVPKLFFGYALGTNLLFPFHVGATAALFADKSTPQRVLAELARRKATVLTNVPTMLNGMLHAELPEGHDFSHLRVTISAGEALPPEVCRRYRERFGHEVLDGIGSAEMFHVYITNRIDDVRPGSLGRIVEGYEAKICDDEGRELPDGELGALWVRGESMGLGYFRRTAETRRSFRGEWLVSADKFHRDAEGYYFYGGRTDDLLKVGGRFVAPIEIENALLSHPAVQEVAVIGYRDEEGLEKPRAFVVPKAGVTPGDELARELQEHAKQKLQPWKYPRQIVFRDGLPKNDRGKVQRALLKG